MKLNEAFGRVITEERKRSRLAAETLALDAGMDPSTLRNTEHGRNNPGLAAMEAIAEGLGKPLSVLIYRAEQAVNESDHTD